MDDEIVTPGAASGCHVKQHDNVGDIDPDILASIIAKDIDREKRTSTLPTFLPPRFPVHGGGDSRIGEYVDDDPTWGDVPWNTRPSPDGESQRSDGGYIDDPIADLRYVVADLSADLAGLASDVENRFKKLTGLIDQFGGDTAESLNRVAEDCQTAISDGERIFKYVKSIYTDAKIAAEQAAANHAESLKNQAAILKNQEMILENQRIMLSKL